MARAFYDGPIVILSAWDRESEKSDTLDAGADDNVEKTFGVGELLARLRVAMRHHLQRAGGPLGGRRRRLPPRAEDKPRQPRPRAGRLSPREYDLLACLAGGGGKVMTHRQLLTAVWGPAHEHDVQYLRVVVGQLRQKLEADPATPRLILTEPGVRYLSFWR